MARRVFYSCHYLPDAWRTSQVRNIGAIDGSKPASDNDWETVKKGGDKAIQRWIDDQLNGRSCTVVLIGKDTANRKWINYEIEKSWNDKKGLVGIYVHNLKDSSQSQSTRGSNPFDYMTMKRDNAKMSSLVKAYNPPYTVSKLVYDYISQNIAAWIDEAVKIRDNY